MWVDVDDVIKFHGLTPQQLKLGKNDDEKLKAMVLEWVLQCEDLIKTYTNNNFKDNVPRAVKNVCLRLTSNMIQVAIQRRDSPIIKVNDWTIKSSGSEIFTDDLKQDLAPFIKEKPSAISDKVEFFAITGD